MTLLMIGILLASISAGAYCASGMPQAPWGGNSAARNIGIAWAAASVLSAPVWAECPAVVVLTGCGAVACALSEWFRREKGRLAMPPVARLRAVKPLTARQC